MKTRFIYLSTLSFLFLCSAGFSQNPNLKNFINGGEFNAPHQSLSEGTVVDVVVHSPGLENNLLGDSPDRDVTVYLPPGYWENPCSYYPVIYLLHGIMGDNNTFLEGGSLNMNIKNTLDNLISENIISPVIVVT